MTKTKVRTAMSKEEEAGFTHAEPHQTIVIGEQPDHAGAKCWYVVGILSTIFCCLPCGVIGLVHAMIAKHEGERGNIGSHKRRLHQAKCWSSWSIVFGLIFLALCIAYVVLVGMYASNYNRSLEKGFEGWNDMEYKGYNDDWRKGEDGKDGEKDWDDQDWNEKDWEQDKGLEDTGDDSERPNFEGNFEFGGGRFRGGFRGGRRGGRGGGRGQDD